MVKNFFKKYLDLVNRHRFIFCAASLAIFVLSVYLSFRLELKSSLKELLPQDSQSVVQLDRMLKKVGGISVLTVTVEGPNVSANKRFVDDLEKKLKELPKDEVRYINAKVSSIREFYENNILHFVDKEDLQKLYERLKRLVDYEKLKKTPLFVDFGMEESPVTLNIDDIKERNEKNVKMPLAVYEDYYGGEEGRFLIVMVRPQGAALAIDKARNLIAKVKGIAADLNPSSYSPYLQVGFCGNVVTMVEEYDTLKHDMVSTAALCIILVAGIIALYFLRLRIVVFLGITLLFGISFTFAVTKFAIGYLNTQTAFLASIVIGTGINYGIIVLGRYLEERKMGMEPRAAIEEALTHTIIPTFLAAATTAISFLVLMIARVRGLSQFGFIGSVGVMSCWLFSFLLLPPVVLISESVLRLFKRLSIPKRRSAVFPAMDKILYHFPVAIIVFAVIMSVVAGAAIHKYVPNSIEYDFSKLRNKVSASQGTEALEKRVAKLWVGSMTPAVALLDHPEDGPAVCKAVVRQNETYSESDRRVDDCHTVYDLLPSNQDAKIPILKKINALLDGKIISRIEGDIGKRLKQVKNSLKKMKLEVEDLPDDLIQNFKDLDGNVGTFAYINPRSGMPLSDGRNLIRFADTIQNISLDDGRVFHATGEYLIFADLIKIVREQAPMLTLLSFVAVSLFVFLCLRRMNESYVVIAGLVWGVLMMIAIMAFIDMRINFFNFIALPLTFGIGVDYSLNIGMRMYRDRNRKTMDIIRYTGGAVILCSATTTIGYYVLTKSNNQAVAQFGLMAIIGEVTCIFSALFLVPALVIVGRRMKHRKSKQKLNPILADEGE